MGRMVFQSREGEKLLESACGLVEQSRAHKREVVSSSPVSAKVFVSLGKIFNLSCLVDPSDMWIAVTGCHNVLSNRLCTLANCRLDEAK